MIFTQPSLRKSGKKRAEWKSSMYEWSKRKLWTRLEWLTCQLGPERGGEVRRARTPIRGNNLAGKWVWGKFQYALLISIHTFNFNMHFTFVPHADFGVIEIKHFPFSGVLRYLCNCFVVKWTGVEEGSVHVKNDMSHLGHLGGLARTFADTPVNMVAQNWHHSRRWSLLLEFGFANPDIQRDIVQLCPLSLNWSG